MKSIVIPLVIFSFFFVGCSKDEPDGGLINGPGDIQQWSYNVGDQLFVLSSDRTDKTEPLARQCLQNLFRFPTIYDKSQDKPDNFTQDPMRYDYIRKDLKVGDTDIKVVWARNWIYSLWNSQVTNFLSEGAFESAFFKDKDPTITKAAYMGNSVYDGPPVDGINAHLKFYNKYYPSFFKVYIVEVNGQEVYRNEDAKSDTIWDEWFGLWSQPFCKYDFGRLIEYVYPVVIILNNDNEFVSIGTKKDVPPAYDTFIH